MQNAFFLLGIALLSVPVYVSNGGEECYDCGPSGWQKMEATCPTSIRSRTQFRDCLAEQTWSSVSGEENIDLFGEGYIEIGGSVVSPAPLHGGIKVYTFRNWAVSEDGQLYLLGELG